MHDWSGLSNKNSIFAMYYSTEVVKRLMTCKTCCVLYRKEVITKAKCSNN